MSAEEIPGLGTAVLGSDGLSGGSISLSQAGDRPRGAAWSHSRSCAASRQPGVTGHRLIVILVQPGISLERLRLCPGNAPPLRTPEASVLATRRMFGNISG